MKKQKTQHSAILFAELQASSDQVHCIVQALKDDKLELHKIENAEHINDSLESLGCELLLVNGDVSLLPEGIQRSIIKQYPNRSIIFLSSAAKQIHETYEHTILPESCSSNLACQIIRQKIEQQRIDALGEEEPKSFLKKISSCMEFSELNRRCTDQFTKELNCKSALFILEYAEQASFKPLATSGIERQAQGRLAGFLTWLYQNHPKRFNHASALTRDYKPWNLKSVLGASNLLVPIRKPSGMWGCLLLGRDPSLNRFDQNDRALAR